MSLAQLLNKDFKMPLGNVKTVNVSLISGQSNFSDCTTLVIIEEKYLISHIKNTCINIKDPPQRDVKSLRLCRGTVTKTQWGGYLIPSQILEVRTIFPLICRAWELLSNFVQILIFSSPPHQTDCWLYLFVSLHMLSTLQWNID